MQNFYLNGARSWRFVISLCGFPMWQVDQATRVRGIRRLGTSDHASSGPDWWCYATTGDYILGSFEVVAKSILGFCSNFRGKSPEAVTAAKLGGEPPIAGLSDNPSRACRASP